MHLLVPFFVDHSRKARRAPGFPWTCDRCGALCLGLRVRGDLVELGLAQVVAVERLEVACDRLVQVVVVLLGVQQARQPLHAQHLVHRRRAVQPVPRRAGHLVIGAVLDGGQVGEGRIGAHRVVDAVRAEQDDRRIPDSQLFHADLDAGAAAGDRKREKTIFSNAGSRSNEAG